MRPFFSRKWIGNTLTKTFKQLSNEIAEHLGVESLPIKFEDLDDENSRLYTHEKYVEINKKYKENYEETAKCIAHENIGIYSKSSMLDYFKMKDQPDGKVLFRTQIKPSTLNDDCSNYINQELKVDAFAFTKFYLEKYEDIDVINRIDGFDKYLDLYIEDNIMIM